MMGSSGSWVEDPRRAGEGCRIVGKGLERGGAGKREYLDFLASMTPRAGEICSL